MSERKLASARTVAEIIEIENADKICAYRIDGWTVVDQKGKYEVNDLVIFCEIDSWVPTEIAPFLTKPGHEAKEYGGVKGERLRTVRLRGQLSQGLILPLTQGYTGAECKRSDGAVRFVEEGDDLTDFLGIQKWEKPLPAALAGLAKGNFPAFIPKTDQPRIQNCGRQLEVWKSQNAMWEVTEKLDGSSMTVYVFGEDEGVCSRNLELKRDEANAFWEAAIKFELLEKIKKTGRNLALQGELVGEGIQGNSYKFLGRQFFCFDIWDIDKQEYLLPEERRNFCRELMISHVPFVGMGLTAADGSGFIETTSAIILKQAQRKSSLNGETEAEGLVYKRVDKHNESFKAISDKWLLKNE